MRRRLMRLTAVCLAALTLDTGCMLSRVVDRAFIGITVRRPSYADRKTTGMFLLPITFAIDAATFPIQALLVVILGDNFPFGDADQGATAVTSIDSPQFDRLTKERQLIALDELNGLIRSGRVTKSTSLALMPDGHWVLVELDTETRNQLLARAQVADPAPTQLAACTP